MPSAPHSSLSHTPPLRCLAYDLRPRFWCGLVQAHDFWCGFYCGISAPPRRIGAQISCTRAVRQEKASMMQTRCPRHAHPLRRIAQQQQWHSGSEEGSTREVLRVCVPGVPITLLGHLVSASGLLLTSCFRAQKLLVWTSNISTGIREIQPAPKTI